MAHKNQYPHFASFPKNPKTLQPIISEEYKIPKKKNGINTLKRLPRENVSKFNTHPLIIINNGMWNTVTKENKGDTSTSYNNIKADVR